MIILEFLIFVISSGLFCSEKFRHHVWAVLVAGAIATGSSLLFAYDLGAKLTGHEKEPPVITKIVKQTVVKPGQTADAASVGKPHRCGDEYPVEAAKRGEQGKTLVGFKILTDGTVDGAAVLTSSGSQILDEAATKCVSEWHYRPKIQDGQLVETSKKVWVTWVLNSAEAAKEAAPKPPELPKPEEPAPELQAQQQQQKLSESHPWYDVGSWFSSDSEKKSP